MPSESIKDIDPSAAPKFPSLTTKIPDEKEPIVFSVALSLGTTSESSVQETKIKWRKIECIMVMN